MVVENFWIGNSNTNYHLNLSGKVRSNVKNNLKNFINITNK